MIEKVPNESDKKFINKNMQSILNNLIQFSDYINKIINISSEDIPFTEKLKQITKKLTDETLSLDQAEEIMDKLYKNFKINNAFKNQDGGAYWRIAVGKLIMTF